MRRTETLIYIDGSSRGNPGPAGIGIVMYDGQRRPLRNMYKYIGETTNNIAEYTALIYSLQEALILSLKEVIVNMDSELLAKQLKGQYRVKDDNLRPLYEQFLHLKTGFNKVEVRLVGREENRDADRLANRAIDSRIDTSLKYK